MSDKCPGVGGRRARDRTRLNAHRYAKALVGRLEFVSPNPKGINPGQVFQVIFQVFLSLPLGVQERCVKEASSVRLPTKTQCSYSLVSNVQRVLGDGLSPPAWKPIGEVGFHCLHPYFVNNAIDVDSDVKVRRGWAAPRPLFPSEEESKMVVDLLSAGVIDEIDPGLAGSEPTLYPTLNLSLRDKNATKSLVVADCRWLIAQSVFAPKPFRLPKLEALYGRGEMWFAKIDLSNAYHSVVLPDDLSSCFCFVVGGRIFRWKRLPFGWDRSPHIFQDLMCSIMRGRRVVVVGSSILVYLDDVLVVGSSPASVGLTVFNVVKELVAEGFIISPKSELEPSQSISWLGKDICCSGARVCVTTSESTLLLCIALIAFVSGKKGPARLLRTLCGLLCWAASHCKLPLPWLQHSHLAMLANARSLPQTAKDHLCVAIEAASKSYSCMPTGWVGAAPVDLLCFLKAQPVLPGVGDGFCTPMVAPWIVFTDAAAAVGRFGIVALYFIRGCVFSVAWSLPLPRALCGTDCQQTAELYAIKVCVSKFLPWGDVRIVSDSSSSIHSCLKMSTKARFRFRGRRGWFSLSSSLFCEQCH